MTEGSIASADGSNSSVPLAPRIPLSGSLSTNISYVDLFDAFVKENDLPVDEDSNPQMTHHYPAIMQSMITRLEKYGRLANMRELTRHSKTAPKTKKTKVEGQDSGSEESDPNDRYYDLDDGFLAPEDDLERENEAEFEDALKEGHFPLKPDQFVPQVTRPASVRPRKVPSKSAPASASANPGRKKKARAMTSYPDEIRKLLFTLKDLYEKNKQESTVVAFPKGSVKLINDVLSLMVSDPVSSTQTIERTDLCLTLCEITEQSLPRIENLASKQLFTNEKAKLAGVYTNQWKKLKSTVVAECKTQAPAWTQDLKDTYTNCVQSLQASVRKTNEFNAIYSKKKPAVAAAEEEKKLEKDVSEWSGGRFLFENGEMKVTEKPAVCVPTSLQSLLVTPPKPASSSKPDPPTPSLPAKPLPRRSSTFEPMPLYRLPRYNPQHFQAKKQSLIDLLDS